MFQEQYREQAKITSNSLEPSAALQVYGNCFDKMLCIRTSKELYGVQQLQTWSK